MRIPEIMRRSSLYPYAAEYYRTYNETFAYNEDRIGFLKILPRIRFIKSAEEDEPRRRVDLFKKLCERSRINYKISEKFLYSLDPLTRPLPKDQTYTPIGNITVDYAKILNEGVFGLKKEMENKITSKTLEKEEKSYLENLLGILDGIVILRNRYLQHLEKLGEEYPANKDVKDLREIFTQIPLQPARTFQEALQSLLFINSLIWMDGHHLVGLGRLDQVLCPFLKRDLETGFIGTAEAMNLIREFLKSLNKYYEYKSSALLGDTGQVIVLGGKNYDGTDATNQLTCMFMDALKELKQPDPKIVLRVHSGTQEEAWEKAYQCLEEGLGYPLFSNDDVIIDSLIDFGYGTEDSYDYSTSACWEPLIPGKSLDQNNLADLKFLEPLMMVLREINSKKSNLNDFKSFLSLYETFLERYVEDIVKSLDEIRFEPSPLLSLLVSYCVENCKDISEGGGRYNHYGLLSVGMGNTINALLNIERVVFEDRKMDLGDVYPTLLDNFRSNGTLQQELLNKGLKYAMDENSVINLTNELIKVVQTKLNDFRNKYGEKYKFGLSSPNYISESVDYPASFDGRKLGEPFGVHISPVNTSNISYTAISNFASALNYKQAFNGDVVDIMVEKGFLKNNKENFLNYLKVSLRKGVLQMQLNVLNPETLIKARKNPELYPNLIVRVWGFSAFFKDLPDEYKDIIIERALQYESQSHQRTTV